MEILYKRDDGTYVIDLSGLPYHVTKDDELFDQVDTYYDEANPDLPEEPVPQPPELPPLTKIYKTSVWKKCTNQEFSLLKAAISSLDERTQAIFNDAQYIDINDELYPLVLAGATAAVGEERALELLVPEA